MIYSRNTNTKPHTNNNSNKFCETVSFEKCNIDIL